MTSSTDLGVALSTERTARAKKKAEAFNRRHIAMMRAEIASRFGNKAAYLLTFETAPYGYVKVSTDAGVVWGWAEDGFSDGDDEFCNLYFYKKQPKNRWTMMFVRPRQAPWAMKVLAGE